MLAKKLIAKYAENCNGCELCVFEAQRQRKIVGLEGSPIRIFRNLDKDPKRPVFMIEIDPGASVDMENIKNICPKYVFEIVEEDE